VDLLNSVGRPAEFDDFSLLQLEVVRRVQLPFLAVSVPVLVVLGRILNELDHVPHYGLRVAARVRFRTQRGRVERKVMFAAVGYFHQDGPPALLSPAELDLILLLRGRHH